MKITKYLVTLGLLGSVTLAPIGADAKDLIVIGHGNQPSGVYDPGAVGNGTSEADLLRNELVPHLRKYLGNDIDIYDTNKDMYGFGTANTVTGYDSVTEIHMDSAGPTATGGHIIYNANSTPDKQDVALKDVAAKYVGLHGTGLKPRTDLYNLNVFAYRGISYRLMELGFITNVNDVQNVRKNIDPLAKDIVKAISGKDVATNDAKPAPTPAAPAEKPKPSTPQIQPASGTFTLSCRLPVSVDLDPNSPEAAYYVAGQSFYYDGYVQANGYVWLTYINYGGTRSYVAIGPDDGNPATTWGWGF